jgi:methyl halide transferase
MVDVNWDERYQGEPEQRPWDSGVVEPELIRGVEALHPKPKRALEIGCGSGTNAIWLAKQEIAVIGTDISPTAVDEAKKKADEARLSIDFRVQDILVEPPVAPESIDFAFDRGVFHIMNEEQRRTFVEHLAQSLQHRGWWLCLAGSADETKPADKGPPRLTATELLASVEARFELHSILRSHFELPDGSQYAAWRALFCKR